MTAAAHCLGVVTGMAAEARCLTGNGGRLEVRVLCSGARPDGARAAASALLRDGAQALLSFGIGGALTADLAPGDVVIADRVLTTDGRELQHDAAWRAAMARGLADVGLAARLGPVVGSDLAAVTPQQKRALHERTGAQLVDMESHISGAAAHRAGVPFAVLRVVADPVGRSIPAIALVGLKADGTTDVPAVLYRLLRQPQALPGLLRLGRDSARALKTLRLIGSMELLKKSLRTASAPH